MLTKCHPRVANSLYEMCLHGIMVVVFIILDWMFVLINTTTMIIYIRQRGKWEGVLNVLLDVIYVKIFKKNSKCFSTGRTYKINQNLNCSSKNVVYWASCNKCNLQYLSSTSTEFKVCFRNHKKNVRASSPL